MAKIKDIFDGERIAVWEDGECVTLSIFPVTIAFLKEDWKDVEKDLKEMLKK